MYVTCICMYKQRYFRVVPQCLFGEWDLVSPFSRPWERWSLTLFLWWGTDPPRSKSSQGLQEQRGTKEQRGPKRNLVFSTLSAATPGWKKVWGRNDGANVSAHNGGLPLALGTSVSPLRRSPSDREQPPGSLMVRARTDRRALQITSFDAAWRDWHPEPRLQLRPW